MSETIYPASSHILNLETANENLAKVKFGMVNLDLDSIRRKIAEGKTPFKKLVMCNMGNPQGLGQKPLTYVRQLITATVCPEMARYFPEDVATKAQQILADSPGHSSGSYSASSGIGCIIEDIASYIARRDGVPRESVRADHIYMCNGATEGILHLLRGIIRSTGCDAVLTPSPGFPLYNAATTYYGGVEVNYELEEGELDPAHPERIPAWGITETCLERALASCRDQGLTPRLLILINPHNPTGSVQTREQIEMTLRFASRHGMVVIADEVYQANIYDPEHFPFVSAHKVMRELEAADPTFKLELLSVHSASKGLAGECGRRGGYWHAAFSNDSPEDASKHDQFLSQMLDIASLGALNTDGMVAMDAIVCPPVPGSPSYAQYAAESAALFEALQRKARVVAEALATWRGMSCCTPVGAMYVYPRIHAPPRAEAEAAREGMTADELYCKDLLESVGVVTLPGQMVGQRPGTYHLRMTILPPEAEIRELLGRWRAFHEAWIARFE